MIAQIKGVVLEDNISNIVISVGGIGLRVFIPTNNSVKVGETTTLHTHVAVRENALDLYGFLETKDRDFFELLLGVSGIGPKTALGILSVSSVSMLQQAISSGDTSHLTKVSGIGKKNAQKIALELKDKLGALNINDSGISNSDVDVVEALQSLGYSQAQAREVLQKIDPSITDTSTRVKEALKNLST